MLEQVRVALGINEAVHKQMDYKLLRLLDRIREEQKEQRVRMDAVLDCENCSHYCRENEVCTHPDGVQSDQCVWREDG